jgi:hypothetical protein
MYVSENQVIMPISRFIVRGIRKRRVYLYLGNVKLIARRIGTLYTTSKGSYVNHRRLGRILAATAIRRIQFTPNTEYSTVFDKVVQSNAAIVPVLMNQILTGVFAGGSKDIIGEAVTVHPFEIDYAEMYAYIRSITFIQDIECLKSYAAAQGVAFVTVNPFTPGTQPAASIRLDVAEEAMRELVTLSQRFRVLTETAPLTPDNVSQRATRYQKLNMEDIISGRISDEFRREEIPDKIVDGTTYITLFSNPSCSFNSAFSSYAYHIAGADDRIATIAAASGVLFPLCISSDDVLSPDYLDLALTSRIAVTFEDQLEADQLVTTAFNKASANVQVIQTKESQALVGAMDTRTDFKGVPGNGNASPYFNQSQGQIPSGVYNPSQRDQADGQQTQQNDGLNRPNKAKTAKRAAPKAAQKGTMRRDAS